MNRNSRPRRRQAGFSMIELLVAFVIFAFGMLGLVGLQTTTLWYGQSSLLRSQATALTDDVLDRMRTDPANARAGNWDTALDVSAADVSSGAAPYQFDLKDWKTEVESLLPQGQASIEVEANVVTITIQWDDSRGRDAAPMQFVTKSRL